ncbi:MAG: hypothetical protein NXI20_18250 [bacterium]|nr:hypothetical protein [bacterium]
MRKIIIFIFGLFLTNLSIAQNYIPNVIPASPEASSITDYSEIKISEYTGSISKSIPIFQIQEGGINVPITLNYNSGGHRVQESASRVGLGWALNAGGVISREMRGQPDDEKGFLSLIEQFENISAPNGPYQYLMSGPDTQERYELLKEIGLGCEDSEPDVFSFNFNGITGKFHFNWDGTLEVSSDQHLIIVPQHEGGNPISPFPILLTDPIVGFVIIDSDGFWYEFDKVETTTIVSTGILRCSISPVNEYNSSWYLTKITNPSKNKEVYFEYDSYILEDYNIVHSVTREHGLGDQSICGSSISGTETQTSTNTRVNGWNLSRIHSNYSPIEAKFIATDVRTDLTGSGLKELDKIEIYNDNTLEREFLLSQDYSSGRLTLRSLQEKSSTASLNPFKFDYNSIALPARNSISQDHWGFYNGSGGTEVFPTYFVNLTGDIQIFGGRDRSPSLTHSSAGVLSKITYPTGGSETYTLELNDYGYVNGVKLSEYETTPKSADIISWGNKDICAGTPGQTDTNEVTFTVSSDPSGVATTTRVIITGDVEFYDELYFGGGIYAPSARLETSSGTLIYEFTEGSSQAQPVVVKDLSPGTYKLITEATMRCNSSRDKAYIKVEFDDYSNNLLKQKYAGGVRVSEVKKLDSDATVVKTSTFNYNMTDGYSSGNIQAEPVYTYGSSKYVESGPLTDVECSFLLALTRSKFSKAGYIGYKSVSITQGAGGNGYSVMHFNVPNATVALQPPFQPATYTDHEAALLNSLELFNSGNNKQHLTKNDYFSSTISTPTLKVGFKGANGPLADYHFDLGNYYVNMGTSKVAISEVTQYDGTSEFVTKQETTYNSRGHFVRSKKIINNDRTIIKEISYPQDVIYAITPVSSLVSAHIYNVPIEEIHLIEISGEQYVTGATYYRYDNLFLKRVHTANFEEPLPKSSFDLAKDLNGSKNSFYNETPEAEFVYSQDYLLETDQKGLSESYLWDQEGRLSAMVSNASNDEIYHTSFEYSGGTSGTSKTGSFYRNSGSFNFSNDGGFTPPTGVDMVMSYWYWSNGKWNFSGEIPFANSFTNGSRLDEIRAYPKKSQMTTYVTHPVYGVTCITDPNGITSNFVYDDLGRLKQVVDFEGNILQEYEYHYSSSN